MLVLSACTSTGQPSGSTAPVSGGTLVYALKADIPGMDAPYVEGTPAYIVLSQIYERLAFVDFDGAIKPQLAESWEASTDLKTWTFKLRQGIKFQDGTPFNAAAVKASYDHILNPPSLVAKTYQAGISSVNVVDDATVRFTATEANASFIYQFVSEFRAAIHSPAAIEKWGKDYIAHPVGTGPFRFVEWKRDDQIVLERNPDYWGEKAKLDKIVFRIVPDAQTTLIELEKGTIHMSNNFPVGQLADISKNANVTVQRAPLLQLFGYWFNVKKEPFTDVRVRKALRLAVDTDTIVKTIGAGLMERAKGPVYVTSPVSHPTLQEPAFNPDEAKRILASAGWTPGPGGILQKDGKPLAFTILATASGIVPKDSDITQAVQQYFKAIGVDAKIDTLELAAFLAKRNQATHEFTWMAIGPRPPDPALTPLDIALSCTGLLGHSYYCNPALDRLLTQAKGTADPEARKKLYFQAQELIWDDHPGIYISNPYSFMVVSNKVGAYRDSTMRLSNLFNGTTLKQ
jgi:peptide/nickel transport system substrate-binding protein